MFAVAFICEACTYFYPIVRVGRDFQVAVKDRGLPVEGLMLEIGIQKLGNKRVAVTNKNGEARFRNALPGSYSLRVDRDAGVPDGVNLEVESGLPTGVSVPLRWPNLPPILVRSLKGTIRGQNYLPGQAQPGFSLDLLEAVSGRVLKNQRSNDKGQFNFGSTKPGLYFLRLNLGEPQSGLISVAVGRTAPAEELDLDLGWSSCGLHYSNCKQRELQLEKLSGQIADSSGAAVANARILLFDQTGILVEQLQSDESGTFTSPRFLSGTYELWVRSPGFTPYRSVVRAEPTRHSPLLVKLGVFGSCSVGEAQ